VSKSQDKIDEELDVIRIINNSRNVMMNSNERKLKYTIKSQYLDEHIQSRLINLDTSSDDGQKGNEQE
jgi:hypothetical protein